jgi:hypothetical protein
MYFPDLELLRYYEGAFRAENWSAPLLAVGWLDHPNAFPTGVIDDAVISKLKALVERARRQGLSCFLGIMHCTFCRAANLPGAGSIWSQENVFIPGTDAAYVAPGEIVHSIEQHSYCPPSEFLQAVLQCPDLFTLMYRDAIQAANQGLRAPSGGGLGWVKLGTSH